MSDRHQRFLVFTFALCALTAISSILSGRGYTNEVALHRWAEVVKITDATEDVAITISRSFPWLSTLLLLLYRVVAGKLPLWLPSLLANCAGAALLAFLFARLRREGTSTTRSSILLACIALHPLFLWPATSGDSQALQLLFYFGLTTAAMRVAEYLDARSLMTMAAFCCLLLFADGRSVYILVATVPFVPLLLPKQVARQGPAAGYMILFLPLAMALMSCGYVGWATTGDPLLLYRTAFGRNAVLEQGGSWQATGPGFPASLVVIPLAAAACFPLRFGMFRHASQPRMAALVFTGVTVVATVLAQADGALTHPASLLFYLIAPWSCLLASRPRTSLTSAIAGTLAGWILFSWLPTTEMKAWNSALAGSTVRTVSGEGTQLGHYLASQPGAVLADDRHLAPAIAARGHASGMILPGNATYRFETRSLAPSADLVIMSHPTSPVRASDRLALRYRDGLAGYSVAWENSEWQVFRRAAPH